MKLIVTETVGFWLLGPMIINNITVDQISHFAELRAGNRTGTAYANTIRVLHKLCKKNRMERTWNGACSDKFQQVKSIDLIHPRRISSQHLACGEFSVSVVATEKNELNHFTSVIFAVRSMGMSMPELVKVEINLTTKSIVDAIAKTIRTIKQRA